MKTDGLHFIKTKEELRKFYTKVLHKYSGRQYCIIGDIDSWERIDAAFLKQYRLDRAEANIKTRILLSHGSQSHNPEDKSLLRDCKYLPKEYIFESTVDIFDDDGILIVNPNINSLAVVIAIPAIVDTFKSMFEIIWGSSK